MSPVRSDHERPTPSERTPLLEEIEPEPLSPSEDPLLDADPDSLIRNVDEENAQERAEKPLPKTQVFLLCLTSVVPSIAFFSIFPYINFMIERVGGVEKEDVGFWSGLIESLFSAVQMCVMILWGKASDRWGRKPVLVLSLFGISVATTLFGMSRNLGQMIVFRCVAGAFGGTVVTVRAMLSDVSTKQTQARAFSLFAFASNMGIFLGPLIGGGLERPAEKFGSTFGKLKFFHQYPYVLPNMVVSAVALIAAFTTLFFVKETLHIHRGNKETGGPPMSTWQLLKYPGVTRVLVIYNYTMLLAYTFTAVYPVFQYTPVELGGLGFVPGLIAATTGLNGASQATWLLLIFPKLHRRFGTIRILYGCAIAWPIFFAASPMFNFLLRHSLKVVLWSTLPPTVVLGSGVAMAFTAVQLALNDIAPSHETLGTLNAVALAGSSGLRAVAPAAATALYAIGVKYHILGGQLFWVCNVVLACGLFGLLRLLPDKAKGLPKRQQNGHAHNT
ncbi:hypothetical protein ACN47E_001009 [Coniothyrium glycines]